VTLSPASNQTVTVNYATADGTATAPSDYAAIASTQLTFLPGETTKPVSVTVNGDTTVEPDETFTVNLSGATNANIGDSQGVGTITNDDGATVVISQIYGGGGNASASFTNDFVEIFNRSTGTIDITNWTIQYQAATTVGGASGTAWATNRVCPTGTCSLASGKYWLVQLASGGAVGASLSPDATPSSPTNMAATAGKVALVNSLTAIVSPTGSGCPSSFATVIDLVGYGSTANCSETAPTSPTFSGNATSVSRKSNGCQDTGNNSSDFTNTSPPVPRNNATAANICP
jgi:hypothetical protein